MTGSKYDFHYIRYCILKIITSKKMLCRLTSLGILWLEVWETSEFSLSTSLCELDLCIPNTKTALFSADLWPWKCTIVLNYPRLFITFWTVCGKYMVLQSYSSYIYVCKLSIISLWVYLTSIIHGNPWRCTWYKLAW